jgi:hypothetical protein
VQILTVLPNPPSQIMKEIQDMFYAFLWGLKLPHIESFCKALKMSWLKKDTIITIFVNNKKNTISFNITIKPNRLTQDVNNVVFLFILWWQQF